MSELFKSKVGWILAGIHLLAVLSCLLYINLIDGKNVIVIFILLILTAPWWDFFASLVYESGIVTGEALRHGLLSLFYEVSGALINAFILYLLGFLLTKAFNHLSSRK